MGRASQFCKEGSSSEVRPGAAPADDRGNGFVGAAACPARLRRGHPCGFHRGVVRMTTSTSHKRARRQLVQAESLLARALPLPSS